MKRLTAFFVGACLMVGIDSVAQISGGALSGGGGTVTSVSVVSANGFAGTVATPTATPAITLTTSISGLLKGSSSALAAALNSDVYGLWTGTCNSSSYLRGDGACASPGTVSSVAFADGSTTPIFTITGSPVTGSGTLTATLATQSANTIFAGPTTGSAAQPGFRSLVSADIPSSIAANTSGTAAGLTGTPNISIGTLTAAGTTNINVSNNATTNIGTGTTTSPVNLGNAAGTGSAVTIAAPTTWNLGTALSAASWGTTGIGWNIAAATVNDSSTGGTNPSIEAVYSIQAPTENATNAQTIASLATLYVVKPNPGSNVTATNTYGIYTVGLSNAGLTTIKGGAVSVNFSSNFNEAFNGGTSTGTFTVGNSGTTGATILAGISTGTNADFLCLSSAGVVLLQSSACTISSLRFKENVEPFYGDAVQVLSGLEIDYFNMKPTKIPNRDRNATATQIGLIAENVADIIPECAIYEHDMKTPKSYRQECVIALLVKAVQEQAAQIKQLQEHRGY